MARGFGSIVVTALVFGAAGFLAGLTVAAREDTGSSKGATDGSIEVVPRSTGRAGVPASPARAADGAVGAVPASRDDATDGGSAAAQLRTRLGRVPPPGREQEAERLAAEIRSEAAARARDADREAAKSIVEAILREEELAADAARGGTIAMLRNLAESGGILLDTAGSSESMAKHFVRQQQGAELAAPDLELFQEVADGTTIRFPAGFHEFPWAVRAIRDDAFPEDLVLAGQGMDKTLVRFSELSPESVVRNLTFRDMTIDCGNEYLCDIRSDEVTIRMERCRVIRFDSGGGGSVMLDAHAAAFFATDCRFEGGLGEGVGMGSLFRADALVARLERCVILGLHSAFDSGGANTTVFSHCEFVQMDAHMSETISRPPTGIRFDDCRVRDALSAGAPPPRADPAFLFEIAKSAGVVGLRSLAAAFPAVCRALPADFEFAPLFADPQDAVALDCAEFAREEGRRPAVVARLAAGSFHAAPPETSGTLVIAGRAMDESLLQLQAPPYAAVVVYRDLTIDCSRAKLFGRRTRLAALMRCRIIGFDDGTENGTAVRAERDGFVWVSDCRIESGFGGRPGSGAAFAPYPGDLRVERTQVVLLGDDLCRDAWDRITMIAGRVTGAAKGTASEMFDWDVQWTGTPVDEVPPSFTPPREPRPLTDINPSWKK